MPKWFLPLAVVSFCFCVGETGVAEEPSSPPFDNRLPRPAQMVPGTEARPVFTMAEKEPFQPRDEAEVIQTIWWTKDEKLVEALHLPRPGAERSSPLRLKWNKRVSLKDADYLLCLFDASWRVDPGNAPRVLILFTANYRKIQTWGEFTCEPGFDYGTIVYPPWSDPETYFVTINPSARFGGALWFEKYLIAPSGIHKLGEGSELTKISDPDWEKKTPN